MSFGCKSPLINLSGYEIKAAICLRRLHNVVQSVKHTGGFKYSAAKGQQRDSSKEDNMTHREKEDKSKLKEEGKKI